MNNSNTDENVFTYGRNCAASTSTSEPLLDITNLNQSISNRSSPDIDVISDEEEDQNFASPKSNAVCLFFLFI